MTAPRLDWSATAGGRYVAACGAEAQGRAVVEPTRGREWRWRLDMLPGDAEPVVYGEAPYLTAQAAMRAAERQAEAWPVLVDGATRGPEA